MILEYAMVHRKRGPSWKFVLHKEYGCLTFRGRKGAEYFLYSHGEFESDVLGLDEPGRCLEIALPNGCNDLAHTFQALTKCEERVISAVVSRMRRDGGEPSLYLRVAGEDTRQVEKQLRDAAVIMLAPEGR